MGKLNTVKQMLQKGLTNKTVQECLTNKIDQSNEAKLLVRTLLKLFSINAKLLIPVSGIDIVKILCAWYENLEETVDKSKRAFYRLLEVMS